MKKDKKVLVTGGAGYVGGHLCRILLERGYQVTVLDSLLFGREAISDLKENPNFEFISGDVRHIEDLTKTIHNTYAIIHLAAIVGDPACEQNEEVTKTVNVESSRVMIELAKQYGVERIIFASSCSVYGAAPSTLLLNEGSYKNPVSLYARTRILSEDILHHQSKEVCVTTLRLATVFGWAWRMRYDLVVNLFTAMASTLGKIEYFGGGQYRPFIHCYDAAKAFADVLESPRNLVENEAFNIGNENLNLTIKEIATEVSSIIPGVNVESNKEKTIDERNYRVDFTKIRHIIGYNTAYGLRHGIEEMTDQINNGNYANWREDIYHNVKYNYKL